MAEDERTMPRNIAGAPALGQVAQGIDYCPIKFGPRTVVNCATSMAFWQELLGFHGELVTDDYTRYLDRFYRDSLARFGDNWHYLDIVNVLYAAAKIIQPKIYLEIGVRRGRSACAVVRACPSVNLVLCDMWQTGYGGMENPGPDFVQEQLRRNGHNGGVKFLNGNSHELIPMLLQANPDVRFDLLTVDGDHTPAGAEADLRRTLPRLSLGGIAVFDDIVHPMHPELLGVWRRVIDSLGCFRTYEFVEAGYGVAFAVKVS